MSPIFRQISNVTGEKLEEKATSFQGFMYENVGPFETGLFMEISNLSLKGRVCMVLCWRVPYISP